MRRTYAGGTGLFTQYSAYKRVGQRFVKPSAGPKSKAKSDEDESQELFLTNDRGANQWYQMVRLQGRFSRCFAAPDRAPSGCRDSQREFLLSVLGATPSDLWARGPAPSSRPQPRLISWFGRYDRKDGLSNSLRVRRADKDEEGLEYEVRAKRQIIDVQ